MTSGIAPVASSPTADTLRTWINATLLPVLDGILRGDNTLADGEVRARHLHAEIGELYPILQMHLLNGAKVLAECRLATTGNHSLSGLAAVDGVSPNAADRILVRAQTDATQNGIYEASGGGWLRAVDADAMTEIGYALTFVDAGATLNGTTWASAAGTTGTIGTTAIPWKRIMRSRDGATGATGATGAAGSNGTNGAAGATGPRGTADASVGGLIATPTVKTYVLVLKAAEACTINEIAAKTTSGTCSAKVQIDGVDVTGASVSVTSTESFGTATAANAVAAGQTISLVVTAAAAPVDLSFTVKATLP